MELNQTLQCKTLNFLQHEMLTCLDSDSGTFLGLGTVTGSVAIYIAFSLQVKTLFVSIQQINELIKQQCSMMLTWSFLMCAEAVLCTGVTWHCCDRPGLPA